MFAWNGGCDVLTAQDTVLEISSAPEVLRSQLQRLVELAKEQNCEDPAGTEQETWRPLYIYICKYPPPKVDVPWFGGMSPTSQVSFVYRKFNGNLLCAVPFFSSIGFRAVKGLW